MFSTWGHENCMYSLCPGVHVRTCPTAVNLFPTVISNQHGYSSAQKVTRSQRSFFSEEPLLKLCSDSRRATRGQIILFLGSYYRREGRQTEQTQDQTRFAWTLYKVLRGCRGRTDQRRSSRASFNQQTCDQIRFCLKDDLETKSTWFLWFNTQRSINWWFWHLKGNSTNTSCDCRSFEEAACNLINCLEWYHSLSCIVGNAVIRLWTLRRIK